ncbi:carbon-nitrogen hydrolase [Mariannaea sp. PMI_226]|nr:carbon-nitrogen hydrolase [Mariannaea sp. PMI_226]
MAPVYNIALIQFDPKPLAVADNFSKAEKYIREAASKGADVALLPEIHLTGWAPENPDFYASMRESASYVAKYQDLARELNINIVPGSICESHMVGDGADKKEEFHNMAYFLTAGTGEIAGAYQKKNLWHPERPHLTSSGHSPHVAFDTPLKHADGRPVRAGMLICWDLAFPEAFRALVADGAELILIPSFWYPSDAGEIGAKINPDAEKIFLQSTTISRAYENTAAIAFCNSGGMSCVAMPIQGALGQIDVDTEDMKIVPVDLDILHVAEENYKVRMDMNGELWHYRHTLRK